MNAIDDAAAQIKVFLYMDAHKGEAEEMTLREFFQTWCRERGRQVKIITDLQRHKQHHGAGFCGLFKLVLSRGSSQDGFPSARPAQRARVKAA